MRGAAAEQPTGRYSGSPWSPLRLAELARRGARVQEALGELVGAAKEGLLALSVGVGLGVLAELMEEEVDEVIGEVDEVIGPTAAMTVIVARCVTATRTAA